MDRFHVGDGRRVEGGALAPQPAQVARMMDGQERVPPVVVLDNFLTEEALRKLRLFCWESTIWRHVYPAGYLGAMPEHGFGTPLLAQIATELRETYPTLFRAHPLRHYWAFKYDSTLKGIALHADFAAVNVNFWITPDAANRDPAHGGLVIWDKPAPFAWDFRTYNDNVAAARAFLAEQGATAQTIPYRANRAVIFDSNLFHETDQLSFEEGYLNRRINVTLLFGQRESI